MDIKPIRDLKITTLAENLVQTGGGVGQWGLSFLLEFSDAKDKQRKVVFDTSLNKDAFLHNVKHLKVELDDVDSVVLSHGHLDHTAATVEVVEAAGGVKVYAHPHTFLPRIHQGKTGKRREIGVPKGEGVAEIEGAGGEVVITADPIEVAPGLWTTGQVERGTFEEVMRLSENERLIVVVDGEEVDDLILDDQALWGVVEGVGPFVITGCAHSGPINTMLQVRKLGSFNSIYSLVGGTHLVGRSDEYLEQTVRELKNFNLEMISPCHCTGFKATAELWKAFPEEFVLNFCCRVIEVGKEPERRLV